MQACHGIGRDQICKPNTHRSWQIIKNLQEDKQSAGNVMSGHVILRGSSCHIYTELVLYILNKCLPKQQRATVHLA
jgi:hypothetical protein